MLKALINDNTPSRIAITGNQPGNRQRIISAISVSDP